jgi:sigma-B regulation protein RsbU (phosphoserine phosphatase)
MEKILRKELRRQKKFTEDILAGMIDLVRVIDKDGRVIFINEPMKEFLGDITGTVCFHALGKNKKCKICISNKTINEGVVSYKEEVVGDKVFSVVSSPIRDENGKIYCAVEVFRDITEKKKLEKTILDQNYRMRKDIDFAKYIQHSILPKDGIYKDMVKIYSKYIPSEMLGGDVFDIVEIDDENIGIYIADVSGHGITASMMTMFIKQTLKNLGKKASDPVYTLNYLNSRYHELQLDDFYYITIFYGVYNKKSRKITMSNGGHNCMPIIFKKDGVEEIFLPGLPVCSLYLKAKYEYYTLKLEKGDKLLFYTDGVTEARGKDRAVYGNKIMQVAVRNKNCQSDEIIENILKDVMKFCDKDVNDDIAIMMIEVL